MKENFTMLDLLIRFIAIAVIFLFAAYLQTCEHSFYY